MPFTKKREKSPSSTPIPSTETGAQNGGAQIPDAEWAAMQKVLDAIYDYRTEDGFDPSKLFHRKVNKRVIPDYYDTIKEPVALSTIKAKIHQHAYPDFATFVRDFALIPHNAQVFNRPDSGAFQDALVVKEQLEKQLQLLVDEGLITKEVAALPDLGEIPTYEDTPAEDVEGEGDEEEESEEEGEEDDDDEGDEDDEGKRKKSRGGRASKAKGEAGEDGADGKKTRGRPPKLLTPTEARIQAVLKGIRKPKSQRGQLLIHDFDRLPDKAAMPEYYLEVKQPMAYDLLKRKVKRKKYKTVEEFMFDVNLMFNNAKAYNTDESEIYKAAVVLQVEAGRLYDVEKAKPDTSFTDEEGKVPMPNGVLHNGELYKTGDWIHIQNLNDLTKPIPAQIFRTYKNPDGQSMVNVCWYYRPEWTVHRVDKHFLPGEVVKTGRYRDHPVEQVEGRCYIMFHTRYFKGRPRGIAEGIEVYVCEARYNEQLHQLNRIKTWASCQPDEVRDKDYEMDLFDYPRKVKKVPSPIAYLLKDDQKETDELPKPQWGADGAPPKIGAVHKRPRGERESLPPEPTPPPPPKMPTPPPRPVVAPTRPSYGSPALSTQQPARPPSTTNRSSSYTASHPQSYMQPSASPVAQQQQQQRPPSAHPTYTPQTPQTQPVAPRAVAPASLATTNYQQAPSHAHNTAPRPSTFAPRPATAQSYRDPPPIEVYTLPTQANLSIPAEVRDLYAQDEFGHVLFFTTPPTAPTQPTDKDFPRGHSVRYLAEKARRKETLLRKRKARDQAAEESLRTAKKAKLAEVEAVQREIQQAQQRALAALSQQLDAGVRGAVSDKALERLQRVQKQVAEQRDAVLANQRRREEARESGLGMGQVVFADDFDNRLVG